MALADRLRRHAEPLRSATGELERVEALAKRLRIATPIVKSSSYVCLRDLVEMTGVCAPIGGACDHRALGAALCRSVPS
jgi:hypothetical protein